MNIVILDGFTTTGENDFTWDFLKPYGTVTAYDRTSQDKVVERIKDAEIVVTNKTVLFKDVLSKAPKVKFIATLSTGYNVVDVDYAKERGVPVANIPAYSTQAVAQLTFALLLELTNHVGLHNREVHEGKWANCADFTFRSAPLTELFGKTIGIIGMGQIGRAVADMAIAMQMKVIAYSPSKRTYETKGDFRWGTVDDIAKEADIVTMHCPLTSETENMINSSFIAKMKPTAFFINTARGQLVDEIALASALNSGKITGAGLDVLATEPPSADNPLLTAKNCYITPHIAWAGYETRARLLQIFESNIKAFIEGNPQNIVNK